MLRAMTSGTPRVSLVVEWDNARYADTERARAMLDRAIDQLRELRRKGPASTDVQSIPTHGLRYYQLKHEGAEHSRGEIVVFVDTDVSRSLAGSASFSRRSRILTCTWSWPVRTSRPPRSTERRLR
jgi:hypothetical protein